MLTGEEAILLLHVKQEGNKVADAIVNARVESSLSFHAEEDEDGRKTQQIWHRCSKLAENDAVGSGNTYHMMHANDSWLKTFKGRQTDGVPTTGSGPMNVSSANTTSRESFRLPGVADLNTR